MGDGKLKLRNLKDNGHFNLDNEFLRGGWGALVKPSGIAAYNVICQHANIKTSKSWPSYNTIAKMCGMSRKTAINAVKRLQKYKIIKIEPQGAGKSNVFLLLHHSEWRWCNNYTGVNTTPRWCNNYTRGGVIVTPGGCNSYTRGGVIVTPKQTNKGNEKKGTKLREESSIENKSSQHLVETPNPPPFFKNEEKQKIPPEIEKQIDELMLEWCEKTKIHDMTDTNRAEEIFNAEQERLINELYHKQDIAILQAPLMKSANLLPAGSETLQRLKGQRAKLLEKSVIKQQTPEEQAIQRARIEKQKRLMLG